MEEDKSKLWTDIGFIIASKYRIKILKVLINSEKTPKLISNETKISINHVSNVLKELLDKNIINILNPNMKKGRLYQISNKGKKIHSIITKIEDDIF
ncbi:MAG: transcriptional regulator [Promethearchaeota archaeon]